MAAADRTARAAPKLSVARAMDERAVVEQLGRLGGRAGDFVAPEPYLAGVAARFASHSALGGNTQLVYQRHVRFLADATRL